MGRRSTSVDQLSQIQMDFMEKEIVFLENGNASLRKRTGFSEKFMMTWVVSWLKDLL